MARAPQPFSSTTRAASIRRLLIGKMPGPLGVGVGHFHTSPGVGVEVGEIDHPVAVHFAGGQDLG